MARIELPRLVAGRERATQYLRPIKDEIKGATVEVDARELRSASPSFADQLVLETLVVGGALQLRVIAAPDQFADFLTESADREGVQDRLRVVHLAAH